ncbi:MAG: hypothetical protein JEY71_06965 [Sphaerochaeta sp.]|nr:hypothetical protein [Sphaerochaeta sp.]
MKKRIVLGGILIMMVLLPLMAASGSNGTWSAGVNIGTGAQSAAQYRINEDLDIIMGIGVDFFSDAIYGDVVANYKVTEFNIDKAKFDVTVGGGALIGFYNSDVELSVVAPAGITYRFDEDVIPLDVYLRVGPAIRIIKGYQTDLIGIYSYIGAMYRF